MFTFFSNRAALLRALLTLAALGLGAVRLPAQISSGGAPTPAAGSATGPDIHDIHSLAPLTFWERHGSEVIIYSITGAVFLALVLWLLLRKKPAPPLTPYQRALQELQFARGLQDTGQDKVFAIAVSDAVRRYLESAYHMPAPERTTEEFLQVAMHHVWLQGELTTLLLRFLEFCDLAKFAGRQFGAEEREQLLNTAREFIETAEKLRQPPATPGAPTPVTPAAPSAKTPAEPTLSAP